MAAPKDDKQSFNWRGWLRMRFGAKPFEERFLYHRVTKTPWYYGDGATLMMLFGVLVVTGIFLGLTYSPSPATAYESMVQITFQNSLGWFLRALHYWSAGMMVIIALVHLFRQILLGGYLPPREGTWLIGVGLFILIIINSFIGYTLRWDERAVYAIRVSLNLFHNIPLIGDELVRFIQGGWTISANTLSRYYAVHILFVPLGILALIGFHLYLVVIHGATTEKELEDPPSSGHEQSQMREELSRNPKSGEDFHPYTTAESGSFALVVFLLVTLLSLTLGPAELYPEANFVSDSYPMEEWWWHWFSAMAAYLPPWISQTVYVVLPLGIIALLLALPFVDRSENRGVRRRPLAVFSVVAILALLLGLTGLRLKSPWTAWPTDQLPPIPENFELTGSAVQGRELFTKYGCHSCHAVGGHGPGVGPNLTGLDVRLSPSELRHYILQPPSGVAMPAYSNRIPEEDLDAVVAFVLVIQTLPRHY